MPFTTIFFDLDDTLYPSSSGIWKLIKDRMNLYMHQRLKIPWDEIPTLREKLFHEFGTTLRGLQVNYKIDTQEKNIVVWAIGHRRDIYENFSGLLLKQ